MASQKDLLSTLEELARNPPQDESTQKAFLAALRKAEFAVERPIDVLHRVAFAALQTCVTRVAVDLNLFELIADNAHSTMSVDELAAKTGANPILLSRLLRFLSSYGLVKESQSGSYASTTGTQSMAQPNLRAGLTYCHDVLLPVFAALPQFLREHNFNPIENVLDTPFQVAHKTDLNPFEWAAQHDNPMIYDNFNKFMAAYRDISPSWLDVFPPQLLLATSSSKVPLLVDIGGGIGHQCEELTLRYPQIERPIILQDLSPPVARALQIPGVTAQVYNFFDEQPVKGATFYYMKSVLHDWPDAKVLEILKNQVASMDKDSKILLDEIVLPETGAHRRTVELDIALMSAVGSIERTQSHWKGLLHSAGLVSEQTLYYDDQMMYAIQILRLA